MVFRLSVCFTGALRLRGENNFEGWKRKSKNALEVLPCLNKWLTTCFWRLNKFYFKLQILNLQLRLSFARGRNPPGRVINFCWWFVVHRLRGSAAAAAMLLWSAGLGMGGPVGVNICLGLLFEHWCQKFISPGGTGHGWTLRCVPMQFWVDSC